MILTTKKILFLIFCLITFVQIAEAQDKSKLIEYNFYPPKVYPAVFIKIDTSLIRLDTASTKLLSPKWIKKIVVLKSKEEKSIYGNKNPTLIIYTKRKFRKEILKVLDIK